MYEKRSNDCAVIQKHFVTLQPDIQFKYVFVMATDKVALWLDIADYDLETAEAMYQTRRRLYVASCAIRSSKSR